MRIFWLIISVVFDPSQLAHSSPCKLIYQQPLIQGMNICLDCYSYCSFPYTESSYLTSFEVRLSLVSSKVMHALSLKIAQTGTFSFNYSK